MFFDHFFNSHTFLSELRAGGVKTTGTIRTSRTGGVMAHLQSDSEPRKQCRSAFNFISDGQVYVVRWNDNCVVTLAGNHLTHDPVRKANRRVKGGTKEVAMPNIVAAYNSGMGGVDLLNRLCSTY